MRNLVSKKGKKLTRVKTRVAAGAFAMVMIAAAIAPVAVHAEAGGTGLTKSGPTAETTEGQYRGGDIEIDGAEYYKAEKRSGTPVEVTVGTGTDMATVTIEMQPWINLTYKGGMKEYNRLVAADIPVWGTGFSLNISELFIHGYIVGVPKVKASIKEPVVTKPKEEPKKEEPKKEEPVKEPEVEKEPAKEPEVEKPKLSENEVSTIKTDVGDFLRFAVSTREESKTSKFVKADQEAELTEAIKKRNTDILGLDDTSVDKIGIEAVRKLLPNLIKSDKAKITDVKIVSADETVVSVTIPVYSTFQTIDEKLKKTMISETTALDKTGSYGAIMGNPLGAKSSVQETMYIETMRMFTDIHKSLGTTDIYTNNPAIYSTGKMELSLRKDAAGLWKIDLDSATINVSLDGKADSIKLLK